MKKISNTAIISPFEGKPDTRQVNADDGRMQFEITARELTPFRAKVANALGAITGLGLSAAALYHGIDLIDADWTYFAVTGLGPLASIPLFEIGIGKLMRKRTEMVLATDEFAFRHGQSWKRYDRRIEHRFSLAPHDKTRKEAEDNEFAVRKAQAAGKIIRKKRYFGESFHLTYEYMGQRNDIAVIYGRKEAMAILSRLKACDTVMNMQASKGKPINLDPEDEWAQQPGDIPEDA